MKILQIIIIKIKLIISCFYILLKYIGLSIIIDCVACLIDLLCSKINNILGQRIYVRLNPFFVYNKVSKKISQSLSFEGFRTIRGNNYGLNNINKCKVLLKFDEGILQKIDSHNKISFITNPQIFAAFKYIASKNLINLQVLKETTITKQSQPLERSSLITTRFLIKSLFNKEDRKNVKNFLFDSIEIKEYSIKITKC